MNRSTCISVLAALVVAPALLAQSITVSPKNDSVVAGQAKQYAATVTGLSNTSVNWYAGGVKGGNSTVGTISSAGLYTAPLNLPAQNPVQIMARSQQSTNVAGATYINILAKGPTISSVSPNPIPTGNLVVTITGTGFLAGAQVIETYAPYGSIALTTTSVTPTSVTASGWQGTGTTAAFMVKNPGSGWSNTIYVPIATSGYYNLSVVGGTGTGTYTKGTVVPIKATPASGQTFQYWSGPNVTDPYSAATTVTMSDQSITVTANYTTGPTYSLSVVNGSGSGNYAQGTVISIKAGAPPAGQMFQSWTGATVASATSPNTTIAMPAAATMVTANFVSIPVPTMSTVSPAIIPTGIYTLTINGTNFQTGTVATLGGTPLSTVVVSASQLRATGLNSAAGTANLFVTNSGVNSNAISMQLGPLNPQVSYNAARHFLQQAAFGPSAGDTTNVQQLGIQGWLTQQFNAPKVSSYAGIANQNSFTPQFLTNAVTNPDQLRQRVAFALSQILVTSITKNIWTTTTAPFEEMLMADAFQNYRQILSDVTLAPAMGQFLDMANNAKANANGTILPNENYAREVMQLFTIGTAMLNIDGTRKLDANNAAIPTYDQNTIANFAKVFTGWTYTPPSGGAVVWGSYINPNAPMVPYPAMHDTTQKTLLQYATPPGVLTVLPAGQSPQADLDQAIDNIFYHPNVAPFVSRQLIQHLVKSNPTPAYVQRVAQVFNNNGSGVRGDMQAVITAILLDPEARQNDQPGMTQTKDGHLQEPALFVAGVLRALGAYIDNTNYFAYELSNMSQDVYNAPSVFNYFSPGYQIPGAGIGGPEFQIYTPYSAIYRDNLISNLFGAWNNNIATYGPGTSIDLTPFVALAGTPQTLVDALDLTFTGGTARSGLKTILLNAVTAESGGNLRRAQTGLYLLLSSSYYNVWN
ncbi:MAG: DUF1800 family protein [Bryobacteraceae bacterium]